MSYLEQDVYPPRVKRIRFADKVYVSLIPIASRMLKALLLPSEELYKVVLQGSRGKDAK